MRAGKAFGQDDISSEESRERVEETIDIVRQAWTQERLTYAGKYWQADNLPVQPQPVQQPHPPLLLAANRDETFAYTARLGCGVIGTLLSQPMPRMQQRLAEYEAAKARGWRRSTATRLRHGVVFRRQNARRGARPGQRKLARRRRRSRGSRLSRALAAIRRSRISPPAPPVG